MSVQNTIFLCLVALILAVTGSAQVTVNGHVLHQGKPITYADVYIKNTPYGALTDDNGRYELTNIPTHKPYTITFSTTGFVTKDTTVFLDKSRTIDINLVKSDETLNEVVISGSLKVVAKTESTIPVDVYSPAFFRANPAPSIHEAVQNINGVRPQINCNICNTGDIHINGLEGPYSMILIDGMPIVSGLATVYGLSGIPQSLIERIEVIKGPASTLYGSEAVGGVINVITKNISKTKPFQGEAFTTSWGEYNIDLATKYKLGKNVQSLIGVNAFMFNQTIDNNGDNFTDVPIQNRVSIFNKWRIIQKNDKLLNVAARFIYEDRWGGEMQWNNAFRGGDSVYGESIYTKRWEIFGDYQLPIKEDIVLSFSSNNHDQNSVYGTMLYLGHQQVHFGQARWNKVWRNKYDLLAGASYRYTWYDDNTPATETQEQNQPSVTQLPGLFAQLETKFNPSNKLLTGLRYDRNSTHGNIFTPRIGYRWSNKTQNTILRIGGGSGYRVVNIFTEDHAALTGAREVVIEPGIAPETSWNGNLNVTRTLKPKSKRYEITIDATGFYTYFYNKIFADYSNPNQIRYSNLDGYAVSKGLSINTTLMHKNGLNAVVGSTLMDVYSLEVSERIRQPFTEQFSTVWKISFPVLKSKLSVDYTGNLYGPMLLPLLSEFDPRNSKSPWWSIQNIQVSHKSRKRYEVFGGVKNLLNWTPNEGNPFLIARAHDPFDKNVVFDADGNAIQTAENPYGLTFDPSYVYGPNQGIRMFLGFRYSIR